MNELADRTSETALERRGDEPRAVIHKNILERAAAAPDAPMTEIASEVPGATVSIVERVLDEYGDPGVDDEQPTAANGEQPTVADAEPNGADTDDAADSEPMVRQPQGNGQLSVPDRDSLTVKQRETLRAIRDYPQATQAELAEHLGVTSATINTRVNAIDGFEWDRRHEFVARLFGDEDPDRDEAGHEDDGSTVVEVEGPTPDEQPPAHGMDDAEPSTDAQTSTDEFDERIEELTTLMESFADCVEEHRESAGVTVEDPELVHKILRACLNDDEISSDEELAIVKTVVG